MTVTAIIIGVVGLIACFVGLDFWWKADTELRKERERRVEAERALRSFPSMPALFDGDAAAAAVLAWKALTDPGCEVLCAASTYPAIATRLDEVLALIDPRDLARGRSAVTHRPGEIRLANGSRILFRFSGRDGRGFTGVRNRWTWWADAGAPPDALRIVAIPASR